MIPIKGPGVEAKQSDSGQFDFSIQPSLQPDEWLINAADAIAKEAASRGLELPAFLGSTILKSSGSADLAPPSAGEPVVRRDTVEIKTYIETQLNAAITGYQRLIGSINTNRQPNSPDYITEANRYDIEQLFVDWFTNAKIEQTYRMLQLDPDMKFSLLAVPNITISAEDVMAVTAIPDSTTLAIYSPEEISGNSAPITKAGSAKPNDRVVNFVLMPDRPTRLIFGTAALQAERLTNFKKIVPDAKVPTVLDTLSYLATKEFETTDFQSSTQGQTIDFSIRHFNMRRMKVQRPQLYNGDMDYVPISGLRQNGKPLLAYSNCMSADTAHIAIG